MLNFSWTSNNAACARGAANMFDKFFVQNKEGDYVELNKGTKKFSKTDAAWGFRALSKKSINDFLFEGHLVIR